MKLKLHRTRTPASDYEYPHMPSDFHLYDMINNQTGRSTENRRYWFRETWSNRDREKQKKKNREKAFVHKQLYYHSTRHNLCSNKAFPNLLPDLHIYVCWFAFLNKIIEWQNIYSKDIEAHWCIFSNHFNFSRNIFGCKFFVCFFVH